MGKGQKNLQQQATARSAEQHATGTAAAKGLMEGSEAFNERKKRIKDRRTAITTGTVADRSDFASNRNMVAERERQREMRSNVMSGGVAGLGENYADPTMVALAKEAYKDEFARDSAAQAESDFKEYVAQTDAMEESLTNQEIGVGQSVMGTAWSNSNQNMQTAAQIAASRASVLPSILGSVISGAAGIATGTNWFQGGARAAGGGASRTGGSYGSAT